jgi:predicted nucleotidyltransferase
MSATQRTMPNAAPTTRIVTLSERKAREAARRATAVAKMLPDLTTYARANDGRYLLSGSAARGAMKWDSDVDILLDFPQAATSAAWTFAEQACRERDLDLGHPDDRRMLPVVPDAHRP